MEMEDGIEEENGRTVTPLNNNSRVTAALRNEQNIYIISSGGIKMEKENPVLNNGST